MKHDISKEARMEYALGKALNMHKLISIEVQKLLYDYAPSAACKNPETFGVICVKCGACGRKFDEFE